MMQYSFPSGQGSSLTYYSVTTSLKTLVDWHKLGVMLKISKPTLKTIRIDYAHYIYTCMWESCVQRFLLMLVCLPEGGNGPSSIVLFS